MAGKKFKYIIKHEAAKMMKQDYVDERNIFEQISK